jgi:CRP-like cAMP-binding protein
LSPQELSAFARLMATQTFEANQGIVVEGYPPPGLYVIVSGKAAVMRNKQGGGADHICDLDAGECVGEVEILDNSACSASVVCYDHVETAVIIKQNLEAYFAAQPVAAAKILRQMVHILSQRLRQSNISYSSLVTIAEGAASE